ncbi:hypothetical protein IAD21_05676 [Abditibacteriota bacterium]|nr:hypothetical protein IAD21_05676 [Abditibacteriota bacterium]
MKRFSSRDTLLMLAPVGVLCAFAWLLRARKPADITPRGPFQPFVRRVQALPALPVEVFDGYDTRVIVEFDARGRLPTWWDKGFGGYSLRDGGQLVRVKGNTTASLKRGGYLSAPHLDSQSKRWISVYNLKLRDIAPRQGQIRLHDTVEFLDNRDKKLANLWLDTPIRANGVTTKIPLVSHVEGVRVESFSIDATPPIESHDGITRWRVKWHLLKNIPRAGAENNHEGINMRVAIVNQKGEQVGSDYSTGYSSRDDEQLQYKPDPDPRVNVVNQDYLLDTGVISTTAKEPLWLKGDIRTGDKWPMAIKIPLRDATGKMLFSPRTSTIPFHVVSVVKLAPSPEDVTDYGADCVVSVVLKAWNAAADVAKWKWGADYSQHLRSASGKSFWELPSKSGKQPIGLAYGWDGDKSRIELRYLLTLKSIPTTAGKLVFHADIAANKSRRVPVEVTVRP